MNAATHLRSGKQASETHLRPTSFPVLFCLPENTHGTNRGAADSLPDGPGTFNAAWRDWIEAKASPESACSLRYHDRAAGCRLAHRSARFLAARPQSKARWFRARLFRQQTRGMIAA